MIEHAATFFDLDGTLVLLDVDIDAIRGEIAELFASRDVAMTFSPILAKIDLAASRVPGIGADLRRQALGLLTKAECEAAQSAELRAGAARAFAEAQARGPVAIVSNNSRAAAAIIAARLGGDVVIVGREDGPPKPDRALFVLAHERVGPARGRYLIVGDAPTDVIAARAASEALGDVEVVAVLGGRGTRQQLEEARPDRVIDDLDELWATP